MALTITSKDGTHELSGVVDAPIRAVWDVLSETDRINHVIFDLPAVEVVEMTASNTRAKISVAGFDLEFDEQPWSWDAPHGYKNVRVFTGGAIERLENSVALTEDGTKTHVKYLVTLKTKGLTGFAVDKVMNPRIARGLAELQGLLEHASGPQRAVWKNPDRARVLAAAKPFADKLASSSNAALVDKLVTHIADAPSAQAARIRPYVLAEAWGADRAEVLALCLEAVGVGLLAMRWDTLCQSCQGPLHSASTLDGVPVKVSCPACQRDWDVAMESDVEAAFAPVPSVRVVEPEMFCIGSPKHTAHWVAQLLLAPGESHPMSPTLGSGVYYVQAAGITERTLVDVGETGDSSVRVTLEGPRGGRGAALPKATPTVKAGRVTIALKNEDGRTHRVQIAHDAAADLAATAAHVTATPAWAALNAPRA